MTEPEPQELILTALLRDALAQGLPVTCFALPLGRTSLPTQTYRRRPGSFVVCSQPSR